MCMTTSIHFKGYIYPVKLNTFFGKMFLWKMSEKTFSEVQSKRFATETETSMWLKSIYKRKSVLNKKIK